jgi:hypothetical protein
MHEKKPNHSTFQRWGKAIKIIAKTICSVHLPERSPGPCPALHLRRSFSETLQRIIVSFLPKKPQGLGSIDKLTYQCYHTLRLNSIFIFQFFAQNRIKRPLLRLHRWMSRHLRHHPDWTCPHLDSALSLPVTHLLQMAFQPHPESSSFLRSWHF